MSPNENFYRSFPEITKAAYEAARIPGNAKLFLVDLTIPDFDNVTGFLQMADTGLGGGALQIPIKGPDFITRRPIIDPLVLKGICTTNHNHLAIQKNETLSQIYRRLGIRRGSKKNLIFTAAGTDLQDIQYALSIYRHLEDSRKDFSKNIPFVDTSSLSAYGLASYINFVLGWHILPKSSNILKYKQN